MLKCDLPECLIEICAAIRQEIQHKSGRGDSFVEDLTTPEYLTIAKLTPEKAIRGTLFGRVIEGPRLRKNNRLNLLFRDVKEELSAAVGVDLIPRNSTLYLDNSAGMCWHTNIDVPGHRLYLIYNETDKSVVKYENPESSDIIIVAEPKGWHIKFFDIPSDIPLWHCVKAGGKRLSIGFRFEGPGVTITQNNS